MRRGGNGHRAKLSHVKQRELDVERGISEITEGLEKYVAVNLKKYVSLDNLLTIINYCRAMKQEINPSTNYRRAILNEFIVFCRFQGNKPFEEFEREDVIRYLDSYRKTDADDPRHRWIGTYNLKLVKLIRFFKWLEYPDKPASDRKRQPKPEVIARISQIKRKEESTYSPNDLWTDADDQLFLKYCPNKRDRCYHVVAKDISGRPDELLKLRIKEMQWHSSNGKQYATVLVNGKTGSRNLPLINSIAYLKEWLAVHPQRGNGDAFLFPSMKHQSLYKKMGVTALNLMYGRYKNTLFPHLLTLDTVPEEDKERIRVLLKKPWNPYIRRHSGLTEKSTILKDGSLLKQYGGWKPKSQMASKYVHYFSDEASKALLQASGIIANDKDGPAVRTVKLCPHCNESNAVDAKYCINPKCGLLLSLEAYQELKEKELKDTEERFVERKKLDIILTHLIARDPGLAAELKKLGFRQDAEPAPVT